MALQSGTVPAAWPQRRRRSHQRRIPQLQSTDGEAARYTRGGGYAREQRFREWDRDNDGFIEATEWRSDNRLFHQLDRDYDTRISPEEFQNRAQREFVGDLDRNNNGVIERNEWKGDEQVFREFDTDGDNVINAEEFRTSGTVAGRQQRFGDIDRNNSGVIEGNEWRGDPQEG